MGVIDANDLEILRFAVMKNLELLLWYKGKMGLGKGVGIAHRINRIKDVLVLLRVSK